MQQLMLRETAAVLGTAFSVLVPTLSCYDRAEREEISTSVRLMLATHEQCVGCEEYRLSDPFGRGEVVFVRPEPVWEIEPEEVTRWVSWEGPEGDLNLELALSRDARARLEEAAEAASSKDMAILIAVDRVAIASYDPDVLPALRGRLLVTTTDHRHFDSITASLGIGRPSVQHVSESDLAAACLRLAGRDRLARRRCLQRSSPEERRGMDEALGRAEGELEADEPDYEAIMSALEHLSDESGD